MFDEKSETARGIIDSLGVFMVMMSIKYNIDFKGQYYDIARRFLNEIVEFEPMEEEKRSSLRPWATK